MDQSVPLESTLSNSKLATTHPRERLYYLNDIVKAGGIHPPGPNPMAKSINKLKLCWFGKSNLLKEYFRVLKSKGIGGANRFVKWLNFVVDSERLLEHDEKGVIHFFIPPTPSKSFARIIRSYNDSYILKRKKIPLHNVLISTTRKCPFNCWYCSATNTPESHMKIDDINKIVSILKEWNVCLIGLTGGEPLLRTDTDEIIRKYADQFTFTLFTSGYGLDRARAQKLKEYGLFYIAISLDDYDNKRHDEARGSKGAFEISIKAINNAKEAGLYTVVQSVITKSMLNSGRIWKFMKFVKELDADELLLLEPLGTGKLLNCGNDVFLTKKEHEQLKSLHNIAQKNPELPKICSFANIEDSTRFGCGAGVEHSYIDTEGNFWPCNFLPISVGNILEEPDAVYSRMERYFSTPCKYCILMAERKELQKEIFFVFSFSTG